MIRRMNHNDIATIVNIHLDSWNPKELSVKLGREFLNVFYKQVVEHPSALSYVYEENSKILGYAVGYSNYEAFNSDIDRLKLMPILLRQFLKGSIKLSDIINLLLDGKKMKHSQYPNQHVGALALANEYKKTKIGKYAIGSVIREIITDLASTYSGASAVCDETNMPMRKTFLHLGFEEVAIIPLFQKKVVMYDMKFSKE